MEGLKNMMEDNVERTLDKLLPTMPHICSCNDCRLDMATYALNRLHPKYGRTNTGAILHRFDTSSAQAEAEILTVVLSAIEVIGSHPHHAPLNQASSEDDTLEDATLEDGTPEDNTPEDDTLEDDTPEDDTAKE